MNGLNLDEIEQKKANFDLNYPEILSKIASAAKKSGRKPEDIKLLAATKTVEPEVINYAISKGLDLIGENRVQEFLSKCDNINLGADKIHFIGTLQTNKVHNIIGRVSTVQSVNSVKLASYISRLSAEKGINTDILIEVNIGDESSKTGADATEILHLCEEISKMEAVKVKGLMAIPPICENNSQVKGFFDNMYNIYIDICNKNIDNIDMQILSMGMSSDFEEAIECGANMVRIGSSLFGARRYL